MAMMRTSKILGGAIQATDGSIGSVDDLLFDDKTWTIRWAVVDTGSWLSGKKVLLPPSCFKRSARESGEFLVDLTREKVKDSPGIATDEPVSSQMETDVYGHYGWAPYWSAGYIVPLGAAGAVVPPLGVGAPMTDRDRLAVEDRQGDPNLRSVDEVTGYYVGATDDDIGHVEEFLIDEDGWAIRYVVVATRNWWPGKKVLVSPSWMRDVSWSDKTVQINLTREKVKGSPQYEPDASIDRGYERRLYRHYDYPPYWVD
jgi:hypothetical protein